MHCCAIKPFDCQQASVYARHYKLLLLIGRTELIEYRSTLLNFELKITKIKGYVT
jgi:hypothetical protein